MSLPNGRPIIFEDCWRFNVKQGPVPDSLLRIFLFFLQFLELLFRDVLQKVLLDIVFRRQLEAVFADGEFLQGFLVLR